MQLQLLIEFLLWMKIIIDNKGVKRVIFTGKENGNFIGRSISSGDFDDDNITDIGLSSWDDNKNYIIYGTDLTP